MIRGRDSACPGIYQPGGGFNLLFLKRSKWKAGFLPGVDSSH